MSWAAEGALYRELRRLTSLEDDLRYLTAHPDEELPEWAPDRLRRPGIGADIRACRRRIEQLKANLPAATAARVVERAERSTRWW